MHHGTNGIFEKTTPSKMKTVSHSWRGSRRGNTEVGHQCVLQGLTDSNSKTTQSLGFLKAGEGGGVFLPSRLPLWKKGGIYYSRNERGQLSCPSHPCSTFYKTPPSFRWAEEGEAGERPFRRHSALHALFLK